MNEMHLNLARKLRSKTFEQIIGQDLSVKMLKNSLFRDYFFPVYLLSGQRGCGKTTTARVFGAAINCEQLSVFQRDPRNTPVPCEQCQSCKAMSQSAHPDFFEIDAASHTGVDMIREIIDAASLLPVMGKKKIYLIDEAHMLSKAAFNALLKVLEEPPVSVLFILATTDPEKIIDTVRSRCFQLFFTPVASKTLVNYLQEICMREGISTDQPGLETIVHETEGSVRDALNLLEQIRFSCTHVSKQAVHDVLGHLDDKRILDLLRAILLGKSVQVVQLCLAIDLPTYSAEFIIRRIFELIRLVLLSKHGVSVQEKHTEYVAIQSLAQATTVRRLCAISDAIYQSEQVITKMTAKHIYLEMLFMRLSQVFSDDDSNNNSNNNDTQSGVIELPVQLEQDTEKELEEQDEQEQFIGDLWKHFLLNLATLQDPMLSSIFSQAQQVYFDDSTHKLVVEFNQAFAFYEDKLNEERSKWMPCLQASYSQQVKPQWKFIHQPLPGKAVSKRIIEIKSSTEEKKVSQKRLPSNKPSTQDTRTRHVSDADMKSLVRAPMLLNYFPGSLYTLGEIHETI